MVGWEEVIFAMLAARNNGTLGMGCAEVFLR